MPQMCAVPMCSKQGGHKFPRDKKRSKQWLEAICRVNYKPSIHSVICKDHFLKEDYELPKDSVLDNPRPLLKKDAVPSKFIWNGDMFDSLDFMTKKKLQQTLNRDLKRKIFRRKVKTQSTHSDTPAEDSSDGESSRAEQTAVSKPEAKDPLELDKPATMEGREVNKLEFGACRFCCVEGEHKNMQTEHVSDSERENYPEMLLECFNIFISTDGGTSSLICEPCVASLRGARDFRRRVVAAELRQRNTTDMVEVTFNVLPGNVHIKPDPDEPDGCVKTAPGSIKSERDADIVGDGAQIPDRRSGGRKNVADYEIIYTDDEDGDLVEKQERLEEYIQNKLDAILTGLPDSDMEMEQEQYTDRNAYACNPESVQQFLEQYYKGHVDGDHPENPFETLKPVAINDNFVNDLVDETTFLNTGCDCENDCLNKFERSEILKSRLDCLELDFDCDSINHLQLIVLGALSSAMDSRAVLREKNLVFKFRGMSVCRKFFKFVYGLEERKFKIILKNFKDRCLAQNFKRSTLSIEQRSDAVRFINNFSEQNSLVLPGRGPNNTDVHILPSSMNRTSVYEMYVRACVEANKEYISPTLWYKCWHDYYPNIIVHPTSDNCKTCRDILNLLSETHSLDAKATRLKEMLDHINYVQLQMVYYQNIIAQVAPILMMDDMSLGHHVPNSYDGLVHYSFDYLQQIHLPHHPEQSGLNLLDCFKVSLFGVAIEPLQKFVLYAIPEPCISDPVNVVISLLHHFFDTFGLGESHVVCHADSIPNQNKNRFMLQYAAWRVMSGRHKSFQLSFLPEGHSEFAPDLYFGLFKTKFRDSNADTLMDICRIAVSSDLKSDSVIGVIVGNETGDVVNVNTYDWKKYFTDHKAASIPQLSTCLHFKTESLNCGTILCSKSPNNFSEQIKVFGSPFVDRMPKIVQPQGLTFERRKYLYEEVRKHVSPDFRNDLCPNPMMAVAIDEKKCLDSSIAQEKKSLDEGILNVSLKNCDEINTESIPKGKISRKTPICSYCGHFGHRNQTTRRGKYVCTKRQSDSDVVARKILKRKR